MNATATLTHFANAHQAINTLHGTWCSCGRWCGTAADAHKTHLADALLLDPEATEAARQFLKAITTLARSLRQMARRMRADFTEVS